MPDSNAVMAVVMVLRVLHVPIRRLADKQVAGITAHKAGRAVVHAAK
jgi:hypothetical protein